MIQSVHPVLRCIFFRTPGLADSFIRFDIRTTDQVDTVGNGGKNSRHDDIPVLVADAFQCLADGSRLSREIQNQGGMLGPFTNNSDLT